MNSLLACLVLLVFNCFPLHAQYDSFAPTVQFIQQKVSCCSAPFSLSTKRKVDNIGITKNGDITLSYSDNKLKQTFNIFELYKENAVATGIDTIMGGKFIQFYVSAEKIRMIRFATATDAQETYTALLRLFTLCKKERKMFSDLNFEQTLDVINTWLAKWTEERNTITLRAQQNGNAVITNKLNQSFPFNFFDLAGAYDNTKIDKDGIEIVSCDVKKHAPLAWINFKTARQKVAFIRLDCYTPIAELEIICGALLHLKSLCTKADTFSNRPAGAIHFVSRNAVLKSEKETLLTSIRSLDKKDEGDTTVTISSNGEGWLDKDSLPIGKWNFYAKDKLGKEYLFKYGVYHRTNPEMFEVKNIDSADLAKNYHLSFIYLQQHKAKTIPFIKSSGWNYYHPGGKLWKIVNYQVQQIPINTSIVMSDPEHDASTRLVIQLKENPDEWIKGELKEYDEDGKLYKKLQYDGFSEVYRKTLYNKNGNVLKMETTKRYENQVLPNNY